jgi:hypothetical protein
MATVANGEAWELPRNIQSKQVPMWRIPIGKSVITLLANSLQA